MAVSRGCDVVTLVTEDPGSAGSAARALAGPVSSPCEGVSKVSNVSNPGGGLCGWVYGWVGVTLVPAHVAVSGW